MKLLLSKFCILTTFFFFLGLFPSFAQRWQSVGDSADAAGTVKLYSDSFTGQLFATGKYQILDSSRKFVGSHVFKFLRGNVWDTLAVQKFDGMGTLKRYKGTLYATGFFQYSDGSTNRFLKLNGTSWDTTSIDLDGHALVFEEFNDTLMIGGLFLKAGNRPFPLFAMYDGQHLFGFQDTIIHSGPGTRALAIEKFQGRFYVGGGFGGHPVGSRQQNLYVFEDGIRSFPSEWYYEDGLARVNMLEVYDGELYVGGGFRESYAHGNSIVKTDGTHWYRLGAGCVGGVTDAVVYHDELWVVGGFNQCDGVPASRVAKWTGTQWCSLSDESMFAYISDIEVHDDTVYIAGNFKDFGYHSANYVAKWVGGDQVWQCGPKHTTFEPLEVPWASSEEIEIVQQEMSIFPNPAVNQITVELPLDYVGQQAYQMINIDGTVVKSGWLSQSTSIDISQLPSGSYVIQTPTSKVAFVKQ